MKSVHPSSKSELGVTPLAGRWGALKPAEPAGTCDFCFFQERLLRMAVGWFYLSFYALCFLGLMCIILTIYWMQLWHGGFAWDGTILMFNYHPVLMVVGLVVLYSAGEYAVMADRPSPRAGWGRALPPRGWPLSLLGLGLWDWGRSGCLWAQVSFAGRSSENGGV